MSVMIPCRDHCYLRYGKQYTSDCDTKCDYARAIIENRALKAKFGVEDKESEDTSSKSEEYPDAEDGDIYYNPYFGDLWIVQEDKFVKINDGYSIELDDPVGFIKVGHIDRYIGSGQEHIITEQIQDKEKEECSEL